MHEYARRAVRARFFTSSPRDCDSLEYLSFSIALLDRRIIASVMGSSIWRHCFNIVQKSSSNNIDLSSRGRSLKEDQVIQLLGDGNFSDIEDFEDDDDEIQPSTFENLQLDDPEPEPQPSVAPEPEPMQDTPGPSQLTPRPRSLRPPSRKRVWKQKILYYVAKGTN
ncbi:unnamed protein product [Parnassius apollo]|uniref:(apollo) hypothetical protein n=1 Tax=Parnassius apollo TaxID=110799 RepID=A0A8S3XY49_PARAO|nr:unnamed protein product [Parnassius apollo]